MPFEDIKWDGRPLYRTGLTANQFRLLEQKLKAEAKSSRGLFHTSNAAAFVVWAADWMRRTYRGGVRKWLDVGDALGVDAPQALWRELTDMGLATCHRPLLVHNGMALRLTTLAREGGFPLAALGRGQYWPKLYLSALVSHLVSASGPTLDSAAVLAGSMENMVPATWRGEELIWLCADLSLAVTELRLAAEHNGGKTGLRTSEWLDRFLPDWKARLPIAMESEEAAGLIDALLYVAAVPISRNVGVTRLLRFQNGNWSAALAIDLDGDLSGLNLACEDGFDRLRIYAAGRLSPYCPGELAVAERNETGDRWSTRSRRPGLTVNCPHDIVAEVELRQDASVVARLMLTGGKPFGDGPLLCNEMEPEGPNRLLHIVGTVSGRFKAERLFAILPDGWTAYAGSETELVETVDERILEGRLTIIRFGAILRGPDGDLHRVRCGLDGDSRDEIALQGRYIDGLVPAKREELVFVGPPTVQFCEGPVMRRPRAGELFTRLIGKSQWELVTGSLPGGYFDVAWKDIGTGHIRAKQRISVLPSGAALKVKSIADKSTVQAVGFSSLSFPEPFVQMKDETWVAEGTAKRLRAVFASLRWDHADQLVRVELSQEPAIAYWNEQYAAPGTVLSIADIGGLVACSDRPIDLIAQLRDRQKVAVPGANLRWRVDAELPLAQIKQDLEFLLTSNPDIDGRVELRFNTAFETYWYVDQFSERFIREGRTLKIRPSMRAERSSLAGRSLVDPFEEHDFGPVASMPLNRPVVLPANLSGPWLVYLRSGREVVSRPEIRIGEGAPVGADGLGPLAEVMAPTDRWERRRLIDRLLSDLTNGTERSGTLCEAIIALATGLDGLPPATFDILQRISETPDALAAIALQASMAGRSLVMGLANALPICWCALPKASWDRAASSLAQRLFSLLGDLPTAPLIVGQEIGARRQAIIALEPGLAAVLGGKTPSRSRQDIAQVFLNRTADSILTFGDFRFRVDLPLPSWPFDQTYWPALNAPCAAALAACTEYRPSGIELSVIRSVARLYPQYFADATNAYYLEHNNGRR